MKRFIIIALVGIAAIYFFRPYQYRFKGMHSLRSKGEVESRMDGYNIFFEEKAKKLCSRMAANNDRLFMLIFSALVLPNNSGINTELEKVFKKLVDSEVLIDESFTILDNISKTEEVQAQKQFRKFFENAVSIMFAQLKAEKAIKKILYKGTEKET